MQSKWMVLAGAMISVTALTVGIAGADDEDSPLHKVMEQVNKQNLVITKGVRTAPLFKKAQKDVVASAEDLVKLSKQARDLGKDVVKKAKDVPNADTKWNELMDSFTASSENLAKVAATSSTSNVPAKDAHTAVKKTCTACHDVFRVEE